MRLICPNCGAQYEVPDDVVPSEGRDVQCSNCGSTWFQKHPDHDHDLADELGLTIPDEEWKPEDEDAAAVAAAAALVEETKSQVSEPEPKPVYEPASEPEPEPTPDPAPQRRQLDQSVAEVLREEAQHEKRARQADGLESQPDLGLDEPSDENSRRAQEARDRMARIRGLPVGAPAKDPEPETMATGTTGSRRDLLPDIDEINSTLRSTSDRKAATKGEVVPATPAQRQRSGFRVGFGLALMVAAVAIVGYVYNKDIVAAVPQAEPYMAEYVARVNELRVWLDGQVTELMLWLDSMASSAGEGDPVAVEATETDG